MEKIIQLESIMLFLKKFSVLIIGCSILGGTLSYCYSAFFINPVYQLSTDFLVNQKLSKNDIEGRLDVQSNQQLVNTYSVVLRSNKILDKVIENLDLSMSSMQLKNKLKVENENNSQVITLSILSESPQIGVKIVNEIANVFQKDISGIMGVQNVSILSKANFIDGNTPVTPKVKTNTMLGCIAGMAIGVILSGLILKLNEKIKSVQDINKLTEIPVIATIPLERKHNGSKPKKKIVNQSS
ncbi:capsule biosynthesis protein [Listeria booriae]|uniref:Capsule biosynthesis protein n=1 Tax=Listeria booriae TaxID=1552123 RepID=A0A842B3G0_9LIST|nr:Wzz/FepE/Etk N-terminal domain-containing protein [Listeria booriae]MBC1796869.1 capsule biosynthesis protein [Listeria booriae]